MLEEDQRAGYCRHCGERLALIKRVKREEFCSEEHRERYLSSTHAVALNRLRETDLGLDIEEEVELVAGSAMEPEPEPVRIERESKEPKELSEPAPPPMAGTIGPVAVNAPLLLAGFWDGDEGRLSQWEPIKPEPTWQHLALRFELAPFSDGGPAMFRQTGVVARVDNTPEHLDLAVNLPRNGIGIDEAANGSQPSSPGTEFDLPRQDYQFTGDLEPYRSTQGAVSVEAEAVEIDSTMYLPAFSPAAADNSQAGSSWPGAEWCLQASWPDAPSLMLALQRANETEEPVWGETLLELPLSSGCVLDTAPPAPDPLYEAEQDPRELEELFEQPAAEPAPKNENVDRVVEERGMSEAVQTIAEGLGTQALGTRIASPFLQEPQPRPGSGKPRWTPVTVSLGSNLEGSTEDWDIL